MHKCVEFDPIPSPIQLRLAKIMWNALPSATAADFLVPPMDVNSTWIDRAVTVVWDNAVNTNLVERHFDLSIASQAGILAATDYSHDKLRVLAVRGIPAGKWWVREAVVWTLLQLPAAPDGNCRITDSAAVYQWKNALHQLALQDQRRLDERERNLRGDIVNMATTGDIISR